MLEISRRSFMAGCAASALLALSPALAFAQEAAVNVADLHAPGQLGEKVLGPAEAPVTVVEYASFSCPHCAAFHRETYAAFRAKYIDTGKVRYIYRDFPLNAPAYAASMIARCAPADRYFEVLDAFYGDQQAWLTAPNLKEATLQRSQPFGFTPQSFDACLSNQALFSGLEAEKARGVGFGVQATPTFFINGKKYEGALSLAQLDEAIEPLL